MGHLYKGGMWFLKKSKIPGYSTEHGPDGTTDLRTTTEGFTYTASKTLPDASSAGNYFYLPALGGYAVGGQKDVGRMGYYWSKSVTTGRWYDQIYAYSLYFDKDNVYMTGYDRSFGYRVQEPFEQKITIACHSLRGKQIGKYMNDSVFTLSFKGV